MRTLSTLFVLQLFCCYAAAQPGTPDSSFGMNARVKEHLSAPAQKMVDAVVQSDGKIVVAAYAEYNYTKRIVLLRYNTNGTLDPGFNGDGIADSLIHPGINKNAYPTVVLLQPDGKILVGGHVDDVNNQNQTTSGVVYRYNTDGSLDNTYGTGGIYKFPYYLSSHVHSMVLLNSSKLMILSNTNQLLQVNGNGTTDLSFGYSGYIELPYNSNSISLLKIAVQPDGKYIVATRAYSNISSEQHAVMLLRYTATGAADGTYGTNGKVFLHPGTEMSDDATDIEMQPDGKLVVSGYGSGTSLYSHTFVARVTTAGTYDSTFGNGGKQLIYLSSGFVSPFAQISLQADNKIVLGGMVKNSSGNYAMATVRFTAIGRYDSTFGVAGISQAATTPENSYGWLPLQQPNGSVMLTGYVRNSNNLKSLALYRVSATGQRDNSFMPAATVPVIGNGNDYEAGLNIHVQRDQKIVTVRERRNGYDYDLVVSRHTTTGTLDSNFGTNGYTYIDLPVAELSPTPNNQRAVYRNVFSTIDTTGKFTIALEYSDMAKGPGVEIIRLTTAGLPDTTFGKLGKVFVNNADNGFVNTLMQAAFQPDGRITLLTLQNDQVRVSPTVDSFFIARISNTGLYDTTFGIKGKLYLSNADQYNFSYYGITVQPDGKVLLAQKYSQYDIVRRFDARGEQDITFGSFGSLKTPGMVMTAGVQPDGKLLLLFPNGSTSGSSLMRLKPNGTIDSTFGTAGISNIYSYLPTVYNLRQIRVVDSSKILITGVNQTGTYYNTLQLVQLKYGNGKPDSAFGQNGLVKILAPYYFRSVNPAELYNQSYNLQSTSVQADGKIVLTGYTDTIINTYGHNYFFMMRLKGTINLTGGRTYTFTGSGLWNAPGNWSDGTMPPATITTGNTIIIDPAASGECILNVPLRISSGASFVVKSGKRLVVQGELIIQ